MGLSSGPLRSPKVLLEIVGVISIFYRQDAITDDQPSVSKKWRQILDMEQKC